MAIQQLDLGAVYNTLAQKRSQDLQAQQSAQQGQMNALQMARYQREDDKAQRQQSALSRLSDPNLDEASKKSILGEAFPELLARQAFQEGQYGIGADGTVINERTGEVVRSPQILDGETAPVSAPQTAPQQRPTLAPGGRGPVPMPVQREELPAQRPYSEGVRNVENTTGNPSARNPRSTATGNGQFTEGTWLDMMGRHATGLTQGKSREEILALREDPEMAAKMTEQYALDNQRIFEQNGIQATPALLYGAHHFGPGAAVKFAKAPDETPLTEILSPEAIKANPHLAKMTVGQARASMEQKFAGVAMPGQQPQQPAPQPETPQAQPTGDGFSRVRNTKGLGLPDAPAGKMWVGRKRADGNGYETKVVPIPGTEGEELFGNDADSHAYRVYRRITAKQANGEPLSEDDQMDLDFATRQLNQSKIATGTDGIVREIKPEPLPTRGGKKATTEQPQPAAPRVTELAPANPKPTNEQALQAGFANRLNSANTTFDQLEAGGYNEPGMKDRIADNIPLVGNFLTSENFQKLEQAQRDFVTAQLRRESGAAISESEFENAKRLYFPQPGDSADVIAQKRATREMAVRNMVQSAGPAKTDFKLGEDGGGNPKVLRFDAQGNMVQ